MPPKNIWRHLKFLFLFINTRRKDVKQNKSHQMKVDLMVLIQFFENMSEIGKKKKKNNGLFRAEMLLHSV